MKIKDPTNGALPVFGALVIACSVLTFCAGCATTATTWQAQLAPDSMANQAVVAVAKNYGGQNAAELASAGLAASAEVLQGYIDKKPPLDVITASPGVEGVGHVVLNILKDKGVVTQKTVDNIYKAADFAARLSYTPKPLPTSTPPPKKSTVNDGP